MKIVFKNSAKLKRIEQQKSAIFCFHYEDVRKNGLDKIVEGSNSSDWRQEA